jgi:hypothetical protein
MDLVFAVAAAVVVEPVPEVFEATAAVVEDVVAAVVAAVVEAAVVVLAAVVVAAVLAAVVPAVVPVVVEVRVTLPLTEPVDVLAVVVAAVVPVVAAVIAEAVVVAAAVVAAAVVAAAADVPLVPLDEPSLELPPQPASARDTDNAQGRITRVAARLAKASAYDDSSCDRVLWACSARKISFDNFAIRPISTIPRALL